MASPYTMLIDLNRCSGCHACSVACKAEHRAPTDFFRHTVQYIENGSFPNVSRTFIPTLCQHCEDAPCLDVCPTNAIFQKEDGSVLIDKDRCIGAGICEDACPYGAIYVNPESGIADKCDFCESRVKEGELPACSATCPTDAILFGHENDFKIKKALEIGGYTQWDPEATKPLVWYKGLNQDSKRNLKRINLSQEDQ